MIRKLGVVNRGSQEKERLTLRDGYTYTQANINEYMN